MSDPIPHARESAVEVRPLPKRDELARMLDARALDDAQHPADEGTILQTDRVIAAYKTADQLLDYFGHKQSAALANPTPVPSGDDVAELRAKLRSAEATIAAALDRETQATDRAKAAEAQRDALQERIAGLEEALRWYEKQVAGCRKLGSIGDPSRQALDRDGGNRARAALYADRPVGASGEGARNTKDEEAAAHD